MSAGRKAARARRARCFQSMNCNRPGQLLAIVTFIAMGCSEGGVARRPGWSPPPEMPGGPAPTIIDLTDAPAEGYEGFCGIIGSGGIRAIVPLGSNGVFAVAHGSGKIVIQDIGRPSALRTLNAHDSPIVELHASVDGQFLLSSSEALDVKLWRVSDGQLVRRVREPGGDFTRLALSPDGTRIAFRLDPTQVSVEQSIDGTVLWQAPTMWGGGLVAFSADGETLVYGGSGYVNFARARDGAAQRQVFVGQPYAIAASSDLSRFLGSHSRTREVSLLDGATGQSLWTIPIPGNGTHVESARFSPDMSQVAFTSRDGGMNLVKTADGSVVREWPVPDGDASALAFSTTGTRLALGLSQGGFQVWDLASGELLIKEAIFPGHRQPVTHVAFSRDRALIASMTADQGPDRSLKVWRTSDAALLYTSDPHPSAGWGRSFAISPDSGTIVHSPGNGQLHMLAARDGSLRGTIENADATSLTFSPDGSLVVGRSHCIGCVPTALRVWRVADGQEQPGFGETPRQSGDGGVFSPDGALLAATSEGRGAWDPDGPAGPETWRGHDLVAVWRVSDRALLWSRPSAVQEFSRAAFSADGKLIAVSASSGVDATSDTGVVRVHDSRSGTMIRELSLPGVRAVAFTPTGELVAAGDSGLRMWRLTDGQPIAQARGSFTALAISPDGQKLVAAARDGSLSLLCGIERALR
jgi:WD40 repeat protein